jgi:cell division protein FtsI (penicillin-binding protein 3)
VVDSAHGTGHKILGNNTYGIAGKTGTAVTALNNKGYNKGNKIYQASFIGYFPYDAPKYSIAVVIQNSQESKLVYGADVSGTVFKEISDKIYGRYLSAQKFSAPAVTDSLSYSYYGYPKELTSIFNFLKMPFTDSAASDKIRRADMKNNFSYLNTPLNSSSSSGSVTPNVVGMGLKDAVYLLENKGLKVTASGRGKVMNQSLVAGTNFNKGQTISLALN